MEIREYQLMAYAAVCYVLDLVYASRALKGYTNLVTSILSNESNEGHCMKYKEIDYSEAFPIIEISGIEEVNTKPWTLSYEFLKKR